MMRYLLVGLCVLASSRCGWGQVADPLSLIESEERSSIAAPGETGQNEPKVGELGRPEAMVFEGLQSFEPEHVRTVISRDFRVLLAAQAGADLKDYLSILEARLAGGFQQCGFPHVDVSAQVMPAKKRILITIEEGERYYNSRIRVEAPREVDAGGLIRFLMDVASSDTTRSAGPWYEDRSPVALYKYGSSHWKVDAPANFFCDPTREYGEVITAGLAAQGYFYPQFEAEWKPGQDGKADLWVHVKSPGAKAVIGKVTVHGLKHHTKEQILDFLKIEPGLAVDYLKKTSWEQKLRDSCCFLESNIAVMPAIGPGAPSELVISLVEQPHGPRLGEELTQRDKLFAETARWLDGWCEGRGGDLVVIDRLDAEPPMHLLVIGSPDHGVLTDWEITVPGRKEPLRYTLVLTKEGQQLVAWHSKRKLRARNDRRQLSAEFRIAYGPKESRSDEWELHTNLRYGLKSREPNDRPFLVATNVSPNLAIAVARNPLNQVRQTGDVLSIVGDETVYRFHAETGELLEMRPEGVDVDWNVIEAGGIPHLEKPARVLTFREGAFESFLEQVKRGSASFPSSHDPQRPVSSVVEFVLKELEYVRQIVDGEAPSGLLLNLVERDAIRPFDLMWIDWQSQTGTGGFWLPESAEDQNFRLFGLERQVPPAMCKSLAGLAFRFHSSLVPTDSGPGQVAWILGLVCTGRQQEATARLNHLLNSPEAGPLTCCYVARLLAMVNPDYSRRFAAAGLERLDDAAFRQEMDYLLPADSLLVQLVQSIAQAVRELDADEFAQLSLRLGDAVQHPAWKKLVERFRKEQGAPSREVLLDGFVIYWNLQGRALCRDRLEEIAARPVVDLEEVTIDALFPEPEILKKKQKKKSAPEKKEQKKKRLRLWNREFRPLSQQ